MKYIDVVQPIILQILNYEGCKKSLLGSSLVYRNIFSELFDKDGMKLEDLPQQEKIAIWNEAKQYCPDSPVNWCKAYKFIQSFEK